MVGTGDSIAVGRVSGERTARLPTTRGPAGARHLRESEATFYQWKSKFAHLGVSELQRLTNVPLGRYATLLNMYRAILQPSAPRWKMKSSRFASAVVLPVASTVCSPWLRVSA